MAPITQDDLLTVQQAAELLQMSTSTIWRWINQGDLPAYRLGQRRVRVRRGDVERIIRPRNNEALAATEDPEGVMPAPLTEEQRQRALATLERLKALHAKLLDERGGELFPDSVELLESIRAERDGELA